jgi:16S rRNA (cytidine1402-2'-O)-methyltransferase
MAGNLYLVPNLLGAVAPERVLPSHTLAVARSVTHWIVETPKPARAFLKTLGADRPIASLAIEPMPEHVDAGIAARLLTPAHAGHDLGLLSDAGCPGVADPGTTLVAAAHEAGLRVIPLVGPSAVLLALMASGMNGQRFMFHGYLPVKPQARAETLARLERDSCAQDRAELFIETPYRNAALLDALCAGLHPATVLCVAADLTLPTETIERRTIADWRRTDHARFDKRPAMFVLQAASEVQPARRAR